MIYCTKLVVILLKRGGDNTRIATIRKNKGISQQELSEYMDITQSAVAKWETGETSPRAALLPKLAKVLGCTIDELMADGEKEEAVSDG